ncbi:hypothetical protein D3C84_1067720 [compost metagenome]
MGMERPPVATTREWQRTSPLLVSSRKPSSVLLTDRTSVWYCCITPAQSHSVSSTSTISLALSSQNNWPSVFSW